MKALHALAASLATVLATVATALPGFAAETLILEYGPIARSVSIESLEDFVEMGVVNDDIDFYINLLGAERAVDFRQALTASRSVNLLRLSQFYYAPMGEGSLAYLGRIFKTGARLSGERAFRAAAIAAAADGEISALEVLQQYPTEYVRVDLQELIRSAREVITAADETVAFIEAVREQAIADANTAPPLNFDALPDLTQLGPYAVNEIELTLTDASRQGQSLNQTATPRRYPATLMLPEAYETRDRPLPVVVISHGLGDTRDSFLAAGRHIASYGFAVVLPEHIGSNSDHKEALYQGLEQEIFLAAEFINRPLDITYLLDELERQNVANYQGQLDLNSVAVIGHSFGGYTALALAGATIDFARLAEQCTYTNVAVNVALLLECRALELSSQPDIIQQLGETGVRDERVKLVMTYAPVSNLFGFQGIRRIEIPTVILGGAFDVVAPVVAEQASAFSWLQTEDKYLYLAENTSHTAGITGLTTDLLDVEQQLEQSIDEGISLTRNVSRALAVAFGQVYLLDNPAYQPFLSSAYVEAVSVAPFNFHLVREIPLDVVELLDAPTP